MDGVGRTLAAPFHRHLLLVFARLKMERERNPVFFSKYKLEGRKCVILLPRLRRMH